MLSTRISQEEQEKIGEKWAPLVQSMEGEDPIESESILISARNGDTDYYADLMNLGLILFHEQNSRPPADFIEDARSFLVADNGLEHPIQEALKINISKF